jgi:hypothetical protein
LSQGRIFWINSLKRTHAYQFPEINKTLFGQEVPRKGLVHPGNVSSDARLLGSFLRLSLHLQTLSYWWGAKNCVWSLNALVTNKIVALKIFLQTEMLRS